MAIFGKQGLQAGALYLAVIWATYGQKRAGFTKQEQVNKIVGISERKTLAGKKLKGKAYRDEAKSMRAARYANILRAGAARTGGAAGAERYKEFESGEFKTAYEKLGYLR